MPLHRQLPQQLITQSKLLMSTRLLQIQNQILRRFQTCKNRQFLKRMFYRQMDNLASLQQKISYLMIMLDDIDSERLDSYIYSSMLNDPYMEEETDTSARHDRMNGMNGMRVMNNNNNNNKRQYNNTPTKYHKNNTAATRSFTPSKSQNNLFTNANRTSAKKVNHNNNYYSYSQLPIDNTETDQAIISSLQNSSNSHLYKDLINFHRSKKSQALLASADSMIHNQKILHQLKKLQMQKKLLKYQARRTPSYTQSPMQCLQSKTNQYPQERTGYVSDYQQQTDADDVESSIDKDTTLKKLSNNYKTTASKHSLSNIKQKKNNQKHLNVINDLFSFRPNDNIKKSRGKNNMREQLGKNTKKKVQIMHNRFLQQDQDDSSLDRKFGRERQQEKQRWQPYRSGRGLMSDEDSWLIQRLNRKIRQQDSLNSMLNSNKPFRVNSDKTLSQYQSKLQRLQQERFMNGKQAQQKGNPFAGRSLCDWELKQKLRQFKNQLNSSPLSNNYHQQPSHSHMPEFQNSNSFDHSVANKRDLNDNDYICYSQSERRKYDNNNYNPMDDKYYRINQNSSKEMFKKKPQLIATQTYYKKNIRSKGNNGRSKTKSKSRQLIKASQSKSKSKSRSKGSPYTRLLSPSTKNLSSTYLRKTNNSNNIKTHSKQKQKRGEIEKRASNRLLNRVRSSGCMIGEIPFSREKEDHRQLVNRYLVDGKRQQEVKQKIITTKQALQTF